MEVKINQVSINQQYVSPTINFSTHIISRYDIEFPNIITGELLCNGRIISLLHPILEIGNEIEIREINNAQNSKNYRENNSNYYKINLLAALDKTKINFIENERQKNERKSVKFSVRLRISGIKIPTFEKSSEYKYQIRIEELFETIEISQNDWLRKFCPFLGIGEFYLIELIKPPLENGNKIWSDLHENLINNLTQMEEELKRGNWQRTIEISRRFFENIKVGDNKQGNKKYKDELIKRMKDLNYDEKGINDLLNGIWHFFEFTSKFIHEKSRNGDFKPIPIAKKEDAYFIYSLSLNLTNLVYKKLSDSS